MYYSLFIWRPIAILKLLVTDSGESEKTKEDEDSQEDGKVPSFTVLLHGSLKVEGMVALTKVG